MLPTHRLHLPLVVSELDHLVPLIHLSPLSPVLKYQPLPSAESPCLLTCLVHTHNYVAAARVQRLLLSTHDTCTPDDAVEALRLLLRAASAESVPRDVHFALGELHYTWGELLEFGKRAELGGEVRIPVVQNRRNTIHQVLITPTMLSDLPADRIQGRSPAARSPQNVPGTTLLRPI